MVWKTYFTFVAINMKTSFQCYNTNCFSFAGFRYDGFFTHWTTWSKFTMVRKIFFFKLITMMMMNFFSTYLWKQSIQWTWLVASTVNGIPSNDFSQTTHVKQLGWYGLPVARNIRSKIGFSHIEHFSNEFLKFTN